MQNNNPTPPISLRNMGSGGIIMEGVVDEFLVPASSVNWAVNVHFDKIGAVTVRDGVTILGAQVADTYSCLGLHQFLDTGTGTNDRLISVFNDTAYALVSGTWTSKRTGMTAGKKARFTNFVDLAFMVNGTDAMQSWDGGAGNFSTTNVTSAPAAAFIDNFRSRVWAAKTSGNPSRLFYSSVASVAGAITWDTATQFIDIAPGDGEDITAIKKFGSALHVFKNSAVYRVFSINQTEPDPQINVGTYSQESVTVTKDGMYWHHPSGIYRLRKGEANPTEISRPIYDIIKNILRSNYSEIASWNDDDHVYFSIGNVTVSGVILTNCVIRWTISTEIWTVYSYAQYFVAGATYDVSSDKMYRVVADNDGNVFTFDSGTTDNGTAINYEMETRWLNISGLRSEKKTIIRMAGLHENMQGASVGWRSGTMNKREIEPIGDGKLEEQETIFNGLQIDFNRLKLSIRGSSSAGGAVFQGFEIIDWLNQGTLDNK